MKDLTSAINGGASRPGRRRFGSIGVRSVSVQLAVREARLKALARELLRQAQLAGNRGDERFKGQRLNEAERVLQRLGPGAGQSQLQAQLSRLRGAPEVKRPQARRRRGPAKLCEDCGVRDAVVSAKYCGGCATRHGWISCTSCGASFRPGKSTAQMPQCRKCSAKSGGSRKSRGTSVWTVSGGLPTLGKRR